MLVCKKLMIFVCHAFWYANGISDTECPDPRPSPNSYRMTNASSFHHGGVIQYGCFMNHIQTGGANSLTCSQGIFRNTPLQCKLNCGNPKNIPGATYDTTPQLFLPGSTVTYTCILDNSTMTAVCDVSLGSWRYGDFDCLEELIWDETPTSTSDNNIDTVYASPLARYPSWARYHGADKNYTVHKVVFIVRQRESPTYINVSIATTRETKMLCSTLNGPFENDKEYTTECEEPVHGFGVNITADFGSEDKNFRVLNISEVHVFGRNNEGDYNDCGSPPILYGADSATNTLQRGDIARYYCLHNFNFINTLNSPSQSTCLPNSTWSQLDNFCGIDQPSPQEQYPTGVECLLEPSGKDYIGKQNYTISGKSCLDWFGHPEVENWSFPGFVINNYCRNPEGNLKEKPWCYVDDYSTTEYCPLVECNMICSMYEDNFDYIGNMNRDTEGNFCLSWESKTVSNEFSLFIPEAFPDKNRAHSYCRNPGRSQKTAWCFTQAQNELVHRPCAIPRCQASVPEVIYVDEMEDLVYEYKYCYLWSNSPHPLLQVCHGNLTQSIIQTYGCIQYRSMHFFISRIFSSGSNLLTESPSTWYFFTCDITTTTDASQSSTLTTETTSFETTSSDWNFNNVSSSQSPTTTTESNLETTPTPASNPNTEMTTDSTMETTSTPTSNLATEVTTDSNPETTLPPTSNLNTEMTTESNLETTPTPTSNLNTEMATNSYGLNSTINGTNHSSSTERVSTASLDRTTTAPKFQNTCSCSCQKDKKIATVEKEMKKLQKELTVEKSTLSTTIRKQTSAVDNRPSAISIGYLGIILLIVTFVLIILPDVLGVLFYLTNYLKNRQLISAY